MNLWSSWSSYIEYHVSFIHAVISSSSFLQGLWNNTSVTLFPIFIVSLLLSCTSFSSLCHFFQGVHWAMCTLFLLIILVCLFMHCCCTDTMLSYSADSSCVERERVHVNCSIMWHRYLGNVGCSFEPTLSCDDGV